MWIATHLWATQELVLAPRFVLNIFWIQQVLLEPFLRGMGGRILKSSIQFQRIHRPACSPSINPWPSCPALEPMGRCDPARYENRGSHPSARNILKLQYVAWGSSPSQEPEFWESRNKRLERNTCLVLHTSLEKIQAQSNPVKACDIGTPSGCLSLHHSPLHILSWHECEGRHWLCSTPSQLNPDTFSCSPI